MTRGSKDEAKRRATLAVLVGSDTSCVSAGPYSGAAATIQGLQGAGYSGKVKVVAGTEALDGHQCVHTGTQMANGGRRSDCPGRSFADGVVRLMTGHPEAVAPTTIQVFPRHNAGFSWPFAVYAGNTRCGSNTFEATFAKLWSLF